MTRDEILGMVRQAVTIIGTALAGRGIIGAGEVELLVGIALIVASGVWSWWSKRKAKQISEQKIAAALAYNPTPNDDVLQIAKAMVSDKVSVAEAQTLGNGGAK